MSDHPLLGGKSHHVNFTRINPVYSHLLTEAAWQFSPHDQLGSQQSNLQLLYAQLETSFFGDAVLFQRILPCHLLDLIPIED